jgi:hypothetical protein
MYKLNLSSGTIENLFLDDDPGTQFARFEGLSFSNTGKYFIYFARNSGDPYNSAVALLKVCLFVIR